MGALPQCNAHHRGRGGKASWSRPQGEGRRGRRLQEPGTGPCPGLAERRGAPDGAPGEKGRVLQGPEGVLQAPGAARLQVRPRGLGQAGPSAPWHGRGFPAAGGGGAAGGPAAGRAGGRCGRRRLLRARLAERQRLLLPALLGGAVLREAGEAWAHARPALQPPRRRGRHRFAAALRHHRLPAAHEAGGAACAHQVPAGGAERHRQRREAHSSERGPLPIARAFLGLLSRATAAGARFGHVHPAGVPGPGSAGLGGALRGVLLPGLRVPQRHLLVVEDGPRQGGAHGWPGEGGGAYRAEGGAGGPQGPAPQHGRPEVRRAVEAPRHVFHCRQRGGGQRCLPVRERLPRPARALGPEVRERRVAGRGGPGGERPIHSQRDLGRPAAALPLEPPAVRPAAGGAAAAGGWLRGGAGRRRDLHVPSRLGHAGRRRNAEARAWPQGEA
mmetsp:Transcript_105059/g.306978  ORF Transcript_105059/g.306978 Transcript_105059/m.306978 type:complete len:443 (+) Transcript_105059:545-1873(+)